MMPDVLARWPWWAFAVACLFLAAGTVTGIRWIKANDVPLADTGNPRSAVIEWKMKPADSKAVVDSWKNVMPVAYKGLAIDTFFFIPFYSTLFAFLCFAAARANAPESTMRTFLAAMAWCGWVAGAFDLIENTGIYVQERFHWYFVAAPTACMAWMKWALIAIVPLTALVGFVAAALLRRASPG